MGAPLRHHAGPSVPSGGDAERRRAPRYDMALDAAFGPTGQGGSAVEDHLERTITVNLSRTGVCLYSDILYPIGALLTLHVSLPNRPTTMLFTGAVAWFQKIDLEVHAYRLGIEFGEVSADTQAALDDLLRHPPAAAASRSRRLLIVDDDQELLRGLQLRFEASGFDVITADNGLEALRRGREDHPDLIILDLMLPNMNGYEVCRLLKFDQKYRRIPVILCTARSRQEDMALGRQVGADAFVTKPFDGKALIAKAEELLSAGRE